MKGLKSTLITTIAMGLLAGSAVGVAGQDVSSSEPATVVGTLEDFEGSNPADGSIAENVLRSQTDVSGRLEMSDSRLSGTWTGTQGINRYSPDADGDGVAEVYSGLVTIENEGGTWVGTISGCSGCGAEDSEGFLTDVLHLELVGTAAYEGLSALLYGDQAGLLRGVIVPGDLYLAGAEGLVGA